MTGDKEEQTKNEEKKLDEKKLEEVTGGALSINELEAMGSFVSEFTQKTAVTVRDVARTALIPQYRCTVL